MKRERKFTVETTTRRASEKGVQMVMQFPGPEYFPQSLRRGDTVAFNGGEPLRVTYVRRDDHSGAQRVLLKMEPI